MISFGAFLLKNRQHYNVSHHVVYNIIDSSTYGAEHVVKEWTHRLREIEQCSVGSNYTPPTNTSSKRYNKRLITMSLYISTDTDSLECTVYLPMRKKGAKGTGYEETRRGG